MKKFLILITLSVLLFASRSYSDLSIKYIEKNSIKEKIMPDGSFAVGLASKDSLLETLFFGPNIERRVVIEFKTNPIKTYKGQKDFNFIENSKQIELINAEHSKFKLDLESIVNNRDKLNNAALLDSEYRINYTYRIALNGLSLTSPQWLIDEIKTLDYVKKIHYTFEVSICDDLSNSLIKADSVWNNLGATGEGILIAIIDTGIDPNHSVLNNEKVIGGYNFVSNNSNYFDDHSHGTHCAGIAAANGNGLTGVAPDASLLAVKVLNAGGSGSSDQIIAGIEYSLDPDGNPNTNDGADIISMSLGGSGSPDDEMSSAVNNAVENGCFCAVAAGNAGSGLYTVQSPGCALKVATVGACDNNNAMANFSSRGPNGYNFDIKPDIIAPGVNIYSSIPNNGFDSKSGTSMATPHVAGAAALIKQIHPNWTPEQIKSALMQSAYNTGAEVWAQGSGRLDVLKAAQMQSVLSPASLSFGLIPNYQSLWSKSDTLTLFNLSEETLNYNISIEHNIPYGFSYSLEPESVQLDANTSAQIIFTISVDNSVFPISEANPPTYHGKIVAQAEAGTVESNFVFAKARMFNISFDEMPVMVSIHNRKNLSYTHIWKQYINQVVPIDTFDIIAFFHDDSGFTYLVKEDIIVQSDSGLNVFIPKSEAQHYISFNYQDANGNAIFVSDVGLIEIYHYQGYGFFTFGGMTSNMHFSSFSDRYKFKNIRNAYFNAGNNNYDSYTTSFSILNGMDYSETIFINPNTSKKINHNYELNGRNGNYFVSDWVGNNYLATATTSSTYNSFRPPYIKNNYYRFCGNTDYWKQKSYTTLLGDFSTEFLASPVIKFIDDTVHFFNFNKNDKILHFGKKDDTIRVNQSFPVFKSRTNNQSNKLVLNAYDFLIVSYPSIFQDVYGYNEEKNIELKLKNIYGELVDSTMIPNLLNNAYENNSLYPGFYELELKCDNNFVGNYQGNAIATLRFSNSRDDKNPPYIKKLLFSSDGLIKPYYYVNETIDMECSLGDDYAVQNADFFCRNIEDEEWQFIDANYSYSSNTYSASLDASTLLGYSSFKIVAKDFLNNELEYVINPAFLVKLSAPTLLEPLDSSTMQSATPTFKWTKLGDDLRYTILVSTDMQFNNIVINKSLRDTSYTPELMLNHNKKYYWKVKAVGVNNESSDWSSVWNFKTAPYKISLNAGWNVISSYVIPNSSNLDIMFSSIMDDLVVIRNTSGFAYYPQYNVNTIGNWNYKQGYRVYLRNPVELTIVGADAKPEASQINLNAGWNLVAYLRKSPMPLEEALSSIYENIRAVKNPAGQITFPFYGFNKIEYMLPGEGYWIYLNSPSILMYPGN